MGLSVYVYAYYVFSYLTRNYVFFLYCHCMCICLSMGMSIALTNIDLGLCSCVQSCIRVDGLKFPIGTTYMYYIIVLAIHLITYAHAHTAHSLSIFHFSRRKLTYTYFIFSTYYIYI